MAENRCPCQAPGVLKTWESDLYLCPVHGREWLRSPEKEAAKKAIEEDKPEALWAAVNTFCARIKKKPPIRERIRSAINALLGVQP